MRNSKMFVTGVVLTVSVGLVSCGSSKSKKTEKCENPIQMNGSSLYEMRNLDGLFNLESTTTHIENSDRSMRATTTALPGMERASIVCKPHSEENHYVSPYAKLPASLIIRDRELLVYKGVSFRFEYEVYKHVKVEYAPSDLGLSNSDLSLISNGFSSVHDYDHAMLSVDFLKAKRLDYHAISPNRFSLTAEFQQYDTTIYWLAEYSKD